MRNSEFSSDFEITFRGDYLHVTHPPNFRVTAEGLEKFWSALAEACQKHNCQKILSEGKIQMRKLNAADAYRSGSKAAAIAHLRLACLFYDYVPDDLTEFFKTVAFNRGVAVEFFSDKAAALSWLGVEE